jgi:hypothetical protein
MTSAESTPYVTRIPACRSSSRSWRWPRSARTASQTATSGAGPAALALACSSPPRDPGSEAAAGGDRQLREEQRSLLAVKPRSNRAGDRPSTSTPPSMRTTGSATASSMASASSAIAPPPPRQAHPEPSIPAPSVTIQAGARAPTPPARAPSMTPSTPAASNLMVTQSLLQGNSREANLADLYTARDTARREPRGHPAEHREPARGTRGGLGQLRPTRERGQTAQEPPGVLTAQPRDRRRTGQAGT